MATYATLLAAAKENLQKVLAGIAVEWSEGGHRVRVSDPVVMLQAIERLEMLAAEEAGTPSVRLIADP